MKGMGGNRNLERRAEHYESIIPDAAQAAIRNLLWIR
jgi:hypothetical protein